nr:MAG TPA: hypothetical protein [Caudoviricetes sp.]
MKNCTRCVIIDSGNDSSYIFPAFGCPVCW